jgi:hypothetical protein
LEGDRPRHITCEGESDVTVVRMSGSGEALAAERRVMVMGRMNRKYMMVSVSSGC